MLTPCHFRVWDGEKMHEPPHEYIWDPRDGARRVIGASNGRITCSQPNDGEVMFATGLTDAEGQEIYEGDILERCQKGVYRPEAEDHHLFYGLVKWDESGAWHCEEHSSPVGGSFPLPRALGNARVIGNRYENSELIHEDE